MLCCADQVQLGQRCNPTSNHFKLLDLFVLVPHPVGHSSIPFYDIKHSSEVAPEGTIIVAGAPYVFLLPRDSSDVLEKIGPGCRRLKGSRILPSFSFSPSRLDYQQKRNENDFLRFRGGWATGRRLRPRRPSCSSSSAPYPSRLEGLPVLSPLAPCKPACGVSRPAVASA